MPRTSYLLNFCAAFTVLASLQVWSSSLCVKSIESGATISSWNIAWCDSSSSIVHWAFLYLWSLTGVLVIFYFFKKRITNVYIWTIISFALFWILAFAFAAEIDRRDDSDTLGLLMFFGLMIWSFKRFGKRFSLLNSKGEQVGAGNPLPAE